jgi:DNA (cytosine-5)-methyltransferase 1
MEPPKAISLFSGCGGDSLGLEKAGFKVVAFNEFKSAPISTHLANFPDSVLLKDSNGATDITKIPDSVFEAYKDISVVFAGFPCFVKGTLVLTDSGYKEIEEVSLNDKLFTHMGRFRNIVNLQMKSYSKEIYDIKIKYHPNVISTTQEHPFYVRSKTKVWNNVKRKYDILFDKAKWKEAHQLTMNDYYGMSINSNNIIPEFTVNKPVNGNRNDKITLRLDNKDQWFMMGYFLGDGWVEEGHKITGQDKHTIRFAIHEDDMHIVNRIKNVIPITDKKCDTGKCKKYGCNDLFWWNILKKFGKYAHGKYIPEWVQDAPKEFIQEFISGYMAADGCVYPDGRNKITTVSYNLAFGIQRIYLKLGFIFNINKTIRPKTCIIQGRTVNQCDTYQIEGYLSKSRYTSFIEDNYVWYSPSKITKRIVSDECVYNFEVEEDNSYCVENTLVHNCQGFSSAGKRKPTDSRNQMFRQFVRVVKATKPPYFIGENVAGLLTMKSGPKEEDPSMLEVIRAAFTEIGYSMTYKILEASDYGVPQSRKRLLIVGWKNGQPFEQESFWASVASWGSSQHLPKLSSFVAPTLEGAHKLDSKAIPPDFDNVAIIIPETLIPTGSVHPYVTLKATTFDETYNEKKHDCLLSCGKRISPIHSEILNLNNPSKTIICTYDHQPRLLVGLKSPLASYVRCLLPDELKQIQGFPADFKLTGNQKEQIIQVGNAVPPALVEAICRQLMAKLTPQPKKKKVIVRKQVSVPQ